jgi:hypothetical protein
MGFPEGAHAIGSGKISICGRLIRKDSIWLMSACSLYYVRTRGKSVAIPEEQIRKTMDLLTAWNALGDRAMIIGNLDNYRTEAIDISLHLRLAGPSANCAGIEQDVMSQAFDLSLPLQECKGIGREIQAFMG